MKQTNKKFNYLILILMSIFLFAFGVFFAFFSEMYQNNSKSNNSLSEISLEQKNIKINEEFNSQITQQATLENVGISEADEEVVGGLFDKYTIRLNSISNGSAILKAYDSSVVPGRGWVSIYPGNQENGWGMLENWVHLKLESISPNSGYELESVYLTDMYGRNQIYGYSSFYGWKDCTVDVYFKKSVQKYNITYDLDGGSATNPSSYYDNQSVTLNNPTKTGYDFVGWTGSNGSTLSKSVTIPSGSSGDKYYIAHWKVKTIKVSFDKDGGTGGDSYVYVNYEGKYPSISCPTKTGSEFVGYYWNGYEYYNSSGYNNRTCTFTYDVTFTARWDEIKYTISFSNGSCPTTTSSTVQIAYGDSLSGKSISPPSWTGWNFLGYFYNGTKYFDSNGSGQSFGYPYQKNITVVAQWEKKKFNVDIKKDSGVVDYYYGLNNNWSSSAITSNLTLTNVEAFANLQIVVGNLVEGFAWKIYEISGTEGADYAISSGSASDKHLYITPYNTITITLKSEIKMEINVVSDFSGRYTENSNGGSVKFENGTYGSNGYQGIQYDGGVEFYAKKSYNTNFLGFYYDYDEDGGVGEKITSIGTGDEYYASLSNITASKSIYAVFQFIRNNLIAYAYASDTTTFGDDCSDVGGKVLVAGGTSGASSTFLTGYGLSTTITATANSGYVFIGWYDTLYKLQQDTKNEYTLSTNSEYTVSMENVEMNFYAKFMKLFSVSLLKTTGINDFTIEGYDSLAPTHYNELSGVKAYYHYGQTIGNMTANVDEIRYEWNKWEITSTNAPSLVQTQLTGQTIRGIVMQNYDFVLTAFADPQKFNLNVIAVYSDAGSLVVGNNGGSIQLGLDSSVPSTDPRFSDGIINKPSAKIENYKVTYNQTDNITIKATEKDTYTFVGWFKTLSIDSNQQYFSGAESGQVIPIEKMTEHNLTYYAIFVKNYNIYAYYDIGVNSISLTNGVLHTEGGEKYYQATFHYGEEISSISPQLNYGFGFEGWVVDTEKTTHMLDNFNTSLQYQVSKITMNASDVYLKATTTTVSYNVVIRSCYQDTTESVYDSTVGGGVAFSKTFAQNRTLLGIDTQAVKFTDTISITAIASEGYVFEGWYKIPEGGQYLRGYSSDFYSEDSVTLTHPMEIEPNGSYYIALFKKLYSVNLIASEGIEEVKLNNVKFEDSAKKTFVYGDFVQISAVLEPEYAYKEWILSASSVAPANLDKSSPSNQTIVIYGNTELTATTSGKDFDLTIGFITESTNGSLISSSDGGVVIYNGNTLTPTNNSITIYDVPYSFDITNLVKANEGFEFDWYYETASCALQYGSKIDKLVLMPDHNLTIYAKFTRLSYSLTLNNFYTSQSDNLTKIVGESNRFATQSSFYSFKYEQQPTLWAYAEPGFKLEGIYDDANCTNLVLDCSEKTPTLFNGLNKYTLTSPKMEIGGLTLYALFTRQVFAITTEVSNANITINVQSSAYFGEEVNFEVILGEGLSNLTVEILRTSDNSVATGSEDNSFSMPNYAVYINATAEIDEYNIAFSPNGGSFNKTTYIVDAVGQIIGKVVYGTRNYCYYSNIDFTATQSGAPIPTKVGYTFKGYNTTSSGNGITLISYNTTFSYNVYNIENSSTLYAIWELDDPIVQISYYSSGISSLEYNGNYQNALKATITNFTSDVTYSYAWYKKDGLEIVSTSDVLMLRSVSQSGEYYCEVSINGTTKRVVSDSLNFNINKKELIISVQNKTYYGPVIIGLTNDNISGLISNHFFVSGSISLAEGESDVIYSNENIGLISITMSIKNNDNEFSQDGEDLINNYSFKLNGSVTVKNLGDSYAIFVGAYERTIHSINFNDVLETSVLSGVNLSMSYSLGFESESTTENGVLNNYISYSSINGTLLININSLPTNYDYYNLFINGTLFSGADLNGNKISIPVSLNLISSNQINIALYFTKQCLVNLEYNFTSNEVSEGYARFEYDKIVQTKGSAFISPSNFERKGLIFKNWYYNTNYSLPVSGNWSKTGSATIYADWILPDISLSNLKITINDNGISVTNLNRPYNGNTAIVTVDYINPYITLSASWYKSVSGSWNKIITNKSVSLLNCIDSGLYSFSLTLTYAHETKTLRVGEISQTLSITKNILDFSELSLTKVYDGSVILDDYTFSTGVKSEKLILSCEYSSPDVKIVSGEISNIALTNLSISPVGSALISNYEIPNVILYGTITPYNIELTRTDSKIYDEIIFIKNYSQGITFEKSNINQTINFTLISSSANVGIYNKALNNLTIQYNVKDEANNSVSKTNYNVSISSSTQIEITKANLTGITFVGQTIYYDAEEHMLKITFAEASLSNANLPKGAIEVNYLYNETIITTGFVDAGTYQITAEIKGDSNHNDLIKNANLIIQKVQFSLNFLYGSSDFPTDYQYNGLNAYNEIFVSATNMSGNTIKPSIRKKILYNSLNTNEVIEVGEYVVTYEDIANNSNFELQGPQSAIFTINKKVINLSSDITFADGSLVYNAQDQSADFAGTAEIPSYLVCDKIIVKLFKDDVYTNSLEAKNVGQYQITLKLVLNDDAHYVLENSSKSANLTITPYEINTATTIATKAYDGTNNLPLNAQIRIDFGDSITENLLLDGEYSQTNVGTNITIQNPQIQNFETNLASNYILSSSFVPKGTITNREITINLTQNGTATGEYIYQMYKATKQFTITKDKNSLYISNSILTEYFVIDISGYEIDSEESAYKLLNNVSTTQNHCLISSIKVYDSSTNSLITNGINNYSFTTLNGGISYLKNLVIALISNTDLIYTATAKTITLTLESGTEIYNYTVGGTANIRNFQTSFYSELDDYTTPITEVINAGKYKLRIHDSNLEPFIFQSGTSSVVLDFEIEKAILSKDFGTISINYGETLNKSVSFVGMNNEVLNGTLVYNEGTNTLDVGIYDIYFENATLEGNFENYNISFAGKLQVNPKNINFTADYSGLDLIYDGQNKLAEINEIEYRIKDLENNTITIDQTQITRQFFQTNSQINEDNLINAGSYSIKFSSSNYNFIIDSDTKTFVSFDFQIKPKNITASYNIPENIVYNAQEQLPLSVSFVGVVAGDESRLGEIIIYSNYANFVRYAGLYTATTSITNTNYVIASGATSSEFEVKKYEIEIANPTEIMFTKAFGETDKPMLQTYSPLQENVIIQFNREAGENVGTYSLKTPIIANSNGSLILQNYAVKDGFVDSFNAFEITALTGAEGNLQVELISNIEVVYNGINLTTILLSSLPNTAYVVKNNDGIILDDEDYNLNLTLTFGTQIKNCGEYNLAKHSAESATHLGEITFISNNFKYQIIQKEISLTKNTGTISKIFDNSTDVIFNNEIVISENQIVVGDNVNLAGYYLNKNVGENIAINLKLIGTSASNYKLKESDSTATGNITQRTLTIVPKIDTDTTAFSKIYDGKNEVDVTKLSAHNVAIGDSVVFNGTYSSVVVANNIEITFATANTNYVIAGNYAGNITAKELTLADSSILNKNYDGTTSLNTDKLELQGIVGDDDVSIESANFASAEMGTHEITITLGGADKSNYVITAEIYGAIKDRVITINFNYGDDEIYDFGFVEDTQSILNKLDFLSMLYGTAISDDENGNHTLPIPLRIGYTFENWYIDSNCTELMTNLTIVNDEFIDFDTIKANDYKLNLYANWTIISYNLDITLYTEGLTTNNFTITNEGGSYSLNSNNIIEAEYTTTIEYYSNHTFAITPNEHFKLGQITINGAVQSSLTSLSNVSENTFIRINFTRDSYQVSLNILENNVNGLDASWNIENDIATRTLKYNQEITLPTLSKTGKVFNGYKLTQTSDVVYSSSLGFTFVILDNTSLFADWNGKKIEIHFNFEGGELSVPYTFANEIGKTILVEYGSAFGALPNLSKSGSVHNGFDLFNGTQKIISNVTSATILQLDSDSLILVAIWVDAPNDFEISKEFDASRYGENTYEVFENNISISYSINNVAYLPYTEKFEANTNSKVTFKYDIVEFAYEVKGFKIEDTLLTSGTHIYGNAIFSVNGAYLSITNYSWESACPEIKVIYQPRAVEIERQITNASFADVDFNIDAIFEDGSVMKTYAGSILEISLNTKTGYEVDRYSVALTSASLNEDKLSISSITRSFTIVIVFEKQSYPLNIVVNGESNGLSLNYSLNTSSLKPITSGNAISVRTDDVVEIKAVVNFGYLISETWTLNGGGSATLTNVSNTTENGLICITKRISGFTENLTLTLTASKRTFNVSASVEILEDGEYKTLATGNTAQVKNNSNLVISSGLFNSDIKFIASIETDTFIDEELNINQNKYSFVGWYDTSNLKYDLVSEDLVFNTTISNELNLIAVFELKTFDVKFMSEDTEKGKVSAINGLNAISPQKVGYNGSIYADVKANALAGYTFIKWKIDYIYPEGTITRYQTAETLTNEILNNIKCNLTCTSMFETYEITLVTNAVITDGELENANNFISVEEGENSGLTITTISSSRTNIVLTATAQQGFAFSSWEVFETDINDYNIISQETNENNRQSVLTIQFVGTRTSYIINANFERATNKIEVKITLENGTKTEGGVVANQDNYYTGASMVFSAKTETELTAYVKILKGYFLDITAENYYEPIAENISLIALDKTLELTEDEKQIYASYFTFTFSGYNSDFTFRLNAHRQSTTLVLYTRDFTTTDPNLMFVLSGHTAVVEYGTSVVKIANYDWLIPEISNKEFLGWALTKEGVNKIIFANGSLVNSIWLYLDDTFDVYPIYDNKKVKINVEVTPSTAQKNPSIYDELFNDIDISQKSIPVIVNNDYYFYIGASFNLTLPAINNGYTFVKYKYLKINDNNQITWEEIVAHSSEYDNNLINGMFNIDDYSSFEYSYAVNYENFRDYIDGTMYIQIIYGINYSTDISNAFNSHRIGIIGGDISVSGTENKSYGMLNDTLTFTANVNEGYKIKAWYVNGVLLENQTSSSIDVILTIPTTIQCVFIGEQVNVAFGTSANGAGTGIVGGNGFHVGNLNYVFYVGDIINPQATGNVGYDYARSWLHSNGLTYKGDAYLITKEDASVASITLTPLFEVRQIDVNFVMMGGNGVVKKSGTELESGLSGDNKIFVLKQAYNKNLTATISANVKYKISGLALLIDGTEQEFKEDYLNGSLLSIPQTDFNDGSIFEIIVNFEKIYWYNFIEENGTITIIEENNISIVKPFTGIGNRDNPYKIETAQDLVLLAFIINNNITQNNISKYAYNSTITHYELSKSVINMDARFWTPIGTKTNPFNANMSIFKLPINMKVDKNDENYPYTASFDSNLLSKYSNLFGAITDNAKISFIKTNSNTVFIILGIIFGFLLVLILILIIRAIVRKQKIEDFNQQNRKF